MAGTGDRKVQVVLMASSEASLRFVKPHRKTRNDVMIRNDNLNPVARLAPTPRRLALLASVAGIGFAVAIAAAPNGPSTSPGFVTAARADTAMPHPEGFADVVAKVKPA